MRNSDEVIAVLVGDIHLSHTAPPIHDPSSWYDTMAYYLQQITDLCPDWTTPVLCSGDVFDRWNSPPELINFALKHLPRMYAVPGQHDLPYHNYEDVHKSAFWTMVLSDRVRLLTQDPLLLSENKLCLHGFPWGVEITPCSDREDDEDLLHVCIAHSYIWIKDHNYSNAPEIQHLSNYKNRLRTYDAALFGDNHSGFTSKAGDCQILNPGTLIRRRVDELSYQPTIGVLRRSGKVEAVKLDTSKDKYVPVSERIQPRQELNLEEVLQLLTNMSHSVLDYVDAVHRTLESLQVIKEVRQAVLRCIKRKDK